MKVEWNKVTWYSKIIAIVLFVALPFIGFYYGIRYGMILQGTRDSAALTRQNATTSVTSYYENVSAWQVGDRSDAGFSIAYPIDFDTNDSYATTPSIDWRFGVDESQPGVLAFTLMIPRAFEPQTNFADAKLTVGYSANGVAVAQCLMPGPASGPSSATSSAMINGVAFTVFHATDAGAGNYYETTSYRTVQAGKCWAVEYTIHSSQIANYPPQYGLQPFDKAKLTDLLDRIVGTFRFQ
ncbi:MAG: hypothetical protein ABSE18_01760 [Minisyncoccia bacterium]|jgi:hypothetical protein